MSAPTPASSTPAASGVASAAKSMGFFELLEWLLKLSEKLAGFLDVRSSKLSMQSKVHVAALKKAAKRAARFIHPFVFLGIAAWMVFWQVISMFYVFPRNYLWPLLALFSVPFVYLTLLYWAFSLLAKAADIVTKLPEVAFKAEIVDERHGILMDIKQTLNHIRNNMGFLFMGSMFNHTIVGEIFLIVGAVGSYVARHTSGREDQMDAAPVKRTVTAEWANGGIKEDLEIEVNKDNKVLKAFNSLPANYQTLLKIIRMPAMVMFLVTGAIFQFAVNTQCGEESWVSITASWFQGYDVNVVCDGGNAEVPDSAHTFVMNERSRDVLEKSDSMLKTKDILALADQVGSKVFKSHLVKSTDDPLAGVKNLSGESCLETEDGPITSACLNILARGLSPKQKEKLKEKLDTRVSWNATQTMPERSVLANVMPSLATRTTALSRLSIAMDASCWFGEEVGCQERVARFGHTLEYDPDTRKLHMVSLDRKMGREFNRGFWETLTGRDLFGHRTVVLGQDANAVHRDFFRIIDSAGERKDEVIQGYWVEALTLGFIPSILKNADRSASLKMEQKDTKQFLPEVLHPVTETLKRLLLLAFYTVFYGICVAGIIMIMLFVIGLLSGGGKKAGGGGSPKPAAAHH